MTNLMSKIPRIMTAVPSTRDVDRTSSFQSSGRTAKLVSNAQNYCSQYDALEQSNVGPGSYDVMKSWVAQRPLSESPVNSRIKFVAVKQYDRPWLQKPTSFGYRNKADRHLRGLSSSEERQEQINAVKNLPRYASS